MKRIILTLALLGGLSLHYSNSENFLDKTAENTDASYVHFAGETDDPSTKIGLAAESAGYNQILRPSLATIFPDLLISEGNESISLSIVAENSAELQISLHAANGAPIIKNIFNIQDGLNHYPMYKSYLQKGVYFVKASSVGHDKVYKFVKN